MRTRDTPPALPVQERVCYVRFYNVFIRPRESGEIHGPPDSRRRTQHRGHVFPSRLGSSLFRLLGLFHSDDAHRHHPSTWTARVRGTSYYPGRSSVFTLFVVFSTAPYLTRNVSRKREIAPLRLPDTCQEKHNKAAGKTFLKGVPRLFRFGDERLWRCHAMIMDRW